MSFSDEQLDLIAEQQARLAKTQYSAREFTVLDSVGKTYDEILNAASNALRRGVSATTEVAKAPLQPFSTHRYSATISSADEVLARYQKMQQERARQLVGSARERALQVLDAEVESRRAEVQALAQSMSVNRAGVGPRRPGLVAQVLPGWDGLDDPYSMLVQGPTGSRPLGYTAYDPKFLLAWQAWKDAKKRRAEAAMM